MPDETMRHATTDSAATMRGTVYIGARHEQQMTTSAKGELVRDMHGVTVYLDDDPLSGWSAERIWIPYHVIDWVALDYGNAAGWSEGFRR